MPKPYAMPFPDSPIKMVGILQDIQDPDDRSKILHHKGQVYPMPTQMAWQFFNIGLGVNLTSHPLVRDLRFVLSKASQE